MGVSDVEVSGVGAVVVVEREQRTAGRHAACGQRGGGAARATLHLALLMGRCAAVRSIHWLAVERAKSKGHGPPCLTFLRACSPTVSRLTKSPLAIPSDGSFAGKGLRPLQANDCCLRRLDP